MNEMNERRGSDSPGNRAIQFDLAEQHQKNTFARKTFKTEEFSHFSDLFRSGGYHPGKDVTDEDHRTGAEAAHRIYFKDRDKPLINKVGLEERERQAVLTR
mmetsp:Transcript_12962/g.15394  ORF Transcript_12962/g.15394 Transcript_12962/m.15394 type:complete len:101 (+) Transcript_12962:3-305(+)